MTDPKFAIKLIYKCPLIDISTLQIVLYRIKVHFEKLLCYIFGGL